MTDTLGDVLVRINPRPLLDRVRIAIARRAQGPATDPATEFVSPAPPTPPAPNPTPTPRLTAPARPRPPT